MFLYSLKKKQNKYYSPGSGITGNKKHYIMKKLSFIMAVAMLLCVSTMQAKNEKISYQIQAGLNLSQITSADVDEVEGLDYKDGVKPGFNLGFRFDYQFNDYFAVQTGLTYTMKGEKYKRSYNGEYYSTEQKTKHTAHYFEIPILAGARYSINDDIQLKFNTGPYIAIGLGGKCKTKYEETNTGDTESHESWQQFFGDPEKEDSEGCKRFDAGWKFELGVDIKNYYVGLAYDLGFVDITNGDVKKANKDNDNYKSMMNRNFSINVGYKF